MVESVRSVPGTLLLFADFEAQAKMLIWKESCCQARRLE